AFPTARSRDLTPDTIPSSASLCRDGFRAYLTDIESMEDGSVELTLGVARRVAQSPPCPLPAAAHEEDGFVVRTDPITGETVRLYVGPGPAPPSAPPTGGEERR